VVVFSYFEDELKKLEGLPMLEVERAVGHLVLHNMAMDQDDTVQLVNVSPCYGGTEVQAAYYPKMPLKGAEHSIVTLTEKLRGDRAFVIGAVYREDEKKFSFHS
jgi:hypothetical protein